MRVVVVIYELFPLFASQTFEWFVLETQTRAMINGQSPELSGYINGWTLHNAAAKFVRFSVKVFAFLRLFSNQSFLLRCRFNVYMASRNDGVGILWETWSHSNTLKWSFTIEVLLFLIKICSRIDAKLQHFPTTASTELKTAPSSMFVFVSRSTRCRSAFRRQSQMSTRISSQHCRASIPILSSSILRRARIVGEVAERVFSVFLGQWQLESTHRKREWLWKWSKLSWVIENSPRSFFMIFYSNKNETWSKFSANLKIPVTSHVDSITVFNS